MKEKILLKYLSNHKKKALISALNSITIKLSVILQRYYFIKSIYIFSEINN